jgi:hypothetical protein
MGTRTRHLCLASVVAAVAATLPLTGCGGGERRPGPREAPDPTASAPPPTPSPRQAPASGCDRFASRRGSDRRSGSRAHPYRTVERLLRSLSAGQTGCLLRGRYRHRGVAMVRRPRVTLRSAPGARAVIDGAVWIERSARGARLTGLRLTSGSATFRIPLKVQADDVTISDNVVTGTTSTSCILVGTDRTARRTVIERNRITRCGSSGKLDHLIYLNHTRNAVVRWNVLSGNPGGWAVHLYTEADGTLIEHNVIDGNHGGVIFAGAGGETSDRNVVRRNAITFSRPRWNLEGSWSGGPRGRGNRAYGNCVYSTGLSARSGIAPEQGFTAYDNVVLSGSPYVDRRRADFRFRAGSPCASRVGDVARAVRRLRP